ncbi:MAG TPA: hypothetical protein VGM37_02605 [Armatimonadota bacterium]|jgi:hypothetical protein
MATSTRFFCSADEERTVLRRILSANDTVALPWRDDFVQTDPAVGLDGLRPWPERERLLLWPRTFGGLQWYGAAPKAHGGTHGQLVHSVLSAATWVDLRLRPGDRLYNFDLSPVLIYERGLMHGRQMQPCSLEAQPSSMARVSAEYARWVRRCLTWVWRRGRIVYRWPDMLAPFRNDLGIANTVRAFPDALRALESGESPYLISWDDRKGLRPDGAPDASG